MTAELAILKTLDAVHPRHMPEAALISDVTLMTTGETRHTVLAAIHRLETRGEIIGIPNPDRGNLWSLSDSGRARLANLQA